MKKILMPLALLLFFTLSLYFGPLYFGVPPGAQAAEDLAALQAKAEKGDAVSQYNMGTRYFNGTDVNKNYTDAADWWRRAAKQGDGAAQIQLASLYAAGHGVTQDYRKAYFWYSIALNDPSSRTAAFASRGHDDAAQHMTPAEVADADKAVAAWKPKPE